MSTALPRKDLFEIPAGVIYLDGNSLGVLPKGVSACATKVIETEWGKQLIRAWNTAGWIDLPRMVGNQIAPLIGAPEGSVTMGDTLSIKVYQALSAALKIRSERRVILSDSGNFPTDLYMAQGLIETLGNDYTLKTPAPENVLADINEDVAVVMLTHVDYRTGRMHDMKAVTEAAHAAGAVMIWDLAHSAGALELDIEGSYTEFAVGCTYKYLNGGPGAPAFIYSRPDIVRLVEPALSGWMGHENPFAMEPLYRPAMSAERLRVGTPPILQLAVLREALAVWDGVCMRDVREQSIRLSELFIDEVKARCPSLTLVSPQDSSQRGSQVSFSFRNSYAVIQALIDRGVIGDFRAPDIMRFGFSPLYIDEYDVAAAAKILQDIMEENSWGDPRYNVRARVT